VTRAETTDPVATERAGAALAARLAPGAVVLVSGELGSGKTTFVRGALRALGVQEPVTSPTFVVGHAFEGRTGPVAHLDLYRLAGMGGEDPGLLDPFFAPDAIVFVEWPEHAERSGDEGAVRGRGAWPPERVTHRVRLEHAGGDRRRVEIEATGELAKEPPEAV
jgi:tRNA threonylcarbamoyladenosine biosynthesis protein TsaE